MWARIGHLQACPSEMPHGASQLCCQPGPEADTEREPRGKQGSWFVGGQFLASGQPLDLSGPQLLIFKGLSLCPQAVSVTGNLLGTVIRQHRGGAAGQETFHTIKP